MRKRWGDMYVNGQRHRDWWGLGVEAVKTEKRETNRKLARAAKKGSAKGFKKGSKKGFDAHNLLHIG
jgi:hypothetical protein